MRSFFKKLTSKRGFSLIELVVSMGLLGIFIVLGYNGVGFMLKDIKKAEAFGAKTTLASNLLNTLVSNSKNFQINYTNTEAVNYLADPLEFQNAWDFDGSIGTVSSCPDCKGRYAYILKPVVGSKQLNELTIKIYHPLFEGDEDINKVKVYKRIVGTRL